MNFKCSNGRKTLMKQDPSGKCLSLKALYSVKVSAHNVAVCGQQFPSDWSFTVYDKYGEHSFLYAWSN